MVLNNSKYVFIDPKNPPSKTLTNLELEKYENHYNQTNIYTKGYITNHIVITVESRSIRLLKVLRNAITKSIKKKNKEWKWY